MAINIFKKEENDTAQKKMAANNSKKVNKVQTEVVAKDPAKTAVSLAAAKILQGAHITEKAARLAKTNEYIFKIDRDANKIEVAKAIESAYKVKVTGVNIINVPDKSRRRGRGIVVKPGYRKAVVAIKEGQTIELLPK